MKVMIDMDGICADFDKGFYDLARKFDNSVPYIDGRSHKSWHVWEGVTKEVQEKCWQHIKASPTFWATLPSLLDWPDRHALCAAELHPRVNMYFVTSRPGNNAKHQTEVWLRTEIGLMHPTVLVVERMTYKALVAQALDIDISIEDNEQNAYHIGQAIGRQNSYLMPRLYNRNAKINPDCASLAAFLAKAGVEVKHV